MEKSALILGMVVSMMIACSAPRQSADRANPEGESDDPPSIIFMNYEIARDTANLTYTARLINTLAAGGKMKSSGPRSTQAKPGDLEFQVLDRNQKLMHTQYISNPLDKVVEFVNDRGELQKNVISLDTAEFSVRYQLEPGAATTLLKRISNPDSESILLLKNHIQ